MNEGYPTEYHEALKQGIETGRMLITEQPLMGSLADEMLMDWAEATYKATNKPVLILAPLVSHHMYRAYAHQCGRAMSFPTDGRHLGPGVNVVNWEKFYNHFEPSAFVGIAFWMSSLVRSTSGYQKLSKLYSTVRAIPRYFVISHLSVVRNECVWFLRAIKDHPLEVEAIKVAPVHVPPIGKTLPPGAFGWSRNGKPIFEGTMTNYGRVVGKSPRYDDSALIERPMALDQSYAMEGLEVIDKTPDCFGTDDWERFYHFMLPRLRALTLGKLEIKYDPAKVVFKPGPEGKCVVQWDDGDASVGLPASMDDYGYIFTLPGCGDDLLVSGIVHIPKLADDKFAGPWWELLADVVSNPKLARVIIYTPEVEVE